MRLSTLALALALAAGGAQATRTLTQSDAAFAAFDRMRAAAARPTSLGAGPAATDAAFVAASVAGAAPAAAGAPGGAAVTVKNDLPGVAEKPVLAPGKPAADAPVNTPAPAKEAGVFYQNVAPAAKAPTIKVGEAAGAAGPPAAASPLKKQEQRVAGDPSSTVAASPATLPAPEKALAAVDALLDRGLARLDGSPAVQEGLRTAAAQAVAGAAGGGGALPAPPRLPSPSDLFTTVESAALPAGGASDGVGAGWMGLGGSARSLLAAAGRQAPHAGEKNPPGSGGGGSGSDALGGLKAETIEFQPIKGVGGGPAAPSHRPPAGGGQASLLGVGMATPSHRPPSDEVAPSHRPALVEVTVMSVPEGAPAGAGASASAASAPSHRPPVQVALMSHRPPSAKADGQAPSHRPPLVEVTLMGAEPGHRPPVVESVAPSHRPPASGEQDGLAVTLFATGDEGGPSHRPPGHRPPSELMTVQLLAGEEPAHRPPAGLAEAKVPSHRPPAGTTTGGSAAPDASASAPAHRPPSATTAQTGGSSAPDAADAAPAHRPPAGGGEEGLAVQLSAEEEEGREAKAGGAQPHAGEKRPPKE